MPVPPAGNPDWIRLRNAFDVVKGQGIAETVVAWDELCRTIDVDLDVLSNPEAHVKLGIVTWLVKSLANRFGMPGAKPTPEFDKWKQGLCECLDKYIVVSGSTSSEEDR